MDTVHQENRQRDLRKVGFVKQNQNDNISEDEEQAKEEETWRPSITSYTHEREYCFLHPPQLSISDGEAHLKANPDCCESRGDSSALSSRRPSAIIAALRRPSQAVALSAAQAVMNQRRYLLGLFNEHSNSNLNGRKEEFNFGMPKRRFTNKLEDNGFTIILSALYAKLLVVLGIAFPITEIITSKTDKPFYYQGFYLYLYLGSILFITYEYVSFIKERAVKDIIRNYPFSEMLILEEVIRRGNISTGKATFLLLLVSSHDQENGDVLIKQKESRPAKIYGSFYLRLGAIAFGIGSMVYSGLEFGRYFELKNIPECYYTVLQAITPFTRMVLTLLQIQFIFLNHKDIDVNRHKIIGRFGLMHTIATNLCEWLCVLVQETKHEMNHLAVSAHLKVNNETEINEKFCPEGRLMGSLVNNASPFLFPCTIEYSLICAVILFEMWKHIKDVDVKEKNEPKRKNRTDPFASGNSGYHFTIDCTRSHKGLFAGIMVIVLTIISLVMFMVLTAREDEFPQETNYAEFEVNIVELFLYVVTSIAVLVAMYQLRSLKYEKKIGTDGIGLDNTLLAVAQTGMFIYCVFSIIGWYFTMNGHTPVGLVADVFSFIQTSLQTMFVFDAWWRRCRNIKQAKTKPGRELITFLIVANMAMWTINTVEKNRAEFRPIHLKFFGAWAWTVITHISMPLAIFYRFHSTICLFEVWKTAYKIKSNFKNPLFPVMNAV